MKPYYYVYRYQDRAPVVRHPTLEAAQAEAERLASQHPGAPIEILKAVGIAKIYGPASTFFMDGEGPEFEKTSCERVRGYERYISALEDVCDSDQLARAQAAVPNTQAMPEHAPDDATKSKP